MAKSSRLSALMVEKAKPAAQPYYLSDDDGTRGGGRLMLRVLPTGSKLWYYRYSVDGVRRSMPMRPFSPRPTEGSYTLEQARERARALAELHRRDESRDVAAYLAAQEAARVAAVAERERLEAEAEQRRLQVAKFTVQALCDWYVAHLKRAGKVSWRDVQAIFAKYVNATRFAELPARELTGRQATELIRAIVDAGHGRTAAKARSYLRAAYALALKAELDPTAPAELIGFGIETNPVANTAALSVYNRTRDRALSGMELGHLWNALAPARSGLKAGEPEAVVPAPAKKRTKAAARRGAKSVPAEERRPVALQAVALSLLLGGQRIAQLLRARVQDVRLDERTLTLHDGKGRRVAARKHVLPLTDDAMALVRLLIAEAAKSGSDWLFVNGKRVTVPKTVSDAGTELAKALQKAGHVSQLFQVRDLRRTAETMMASLGVSKEVRAQVQSHGLGGVQDRHYDRHDYMAEKRAALDAFTAHLSRLAQEAAQQAAAKT